MIDTSVIGRLKVLESLAVLPRVASTNLIARRVMNECIENELSLPQAMIIAGEQFAGRGRNDRSWSSPAGKGIYATTLLTRAVHELSLVPLEIANIIASFLRETFAIDARIKWPNDILVDGKKIAGILIEARVQEERAFLLIGTGINVEAVEGHAPNAVAISEVTTRHFGGVHDATLAFVEHLDARLAQPFEHDRVLADWRALSVHNPGDRIHCVLGDRTIDGTWTGIDEQGRALIREGGRVMPVSAGDILI
jgi:BirA family biotin operon repressor/biotin-[acetyl-CoA-carboxylase] ligase